MATLYGNNNNNKIYAGTNDAVFAQGGDDVVILNGSNAYIEAGSGNDKLYISGNNTTVFGGDGSDYIQIAGDANKVLVTFQETDGDTLWVRGNFNQLSDTNGNGNSVLNSGDVASADRINFSGANNYIQATTADAIYVTGVNNKIDIVGFTGAANGFLVAYQSQAGALTNTLIIENNHQDIVFLRQGNNLVIGFDDQAGQLTVVNQFAGSGYGIAALKANDGFLLTAADLVNVTNALTAYDAATASVTFNSVAAIKASAYAETLIDNAFHV